MADLESFGGGDFRHETSKIRMSSPNDFSAEIGNSNVFFAQNQVFSKKKKKKVFTEIESDFWPKSEILTFFSPKIRWSPKKKRKGLYRN